MIIFVILPLLFKLKVSSQSRQFEFNLGERNWREDE